MAEKIILTRVNGKFKDENGIIYREVLERNAMDYLTCWDFDFDECLDFVEEASRNELLSFIKDYNLSENPEMVCKAYLKGRDILSSYETILNNSFEIHMLVKTRRCKDYELRTFTSTVDALRYLKKKNIKSMVVTINTVKNGKLHREDAILSTRTMGYTTI